MRNKFRFPLWLALLALPVVLFLTHFYLSPLQSPAVDAYVYAVALGWHGLAFALILCLLLAPWVPRQGRPGRILSLSAAALLALIFIAWAVDARVYAIWRFHINLAMLDLFVNGNGQIIELSWETWLTILAQVGAIVAVSALITLVARRLMTTRIPVWPLLAVMLLCCLGVNLTHAYASARNIVTLTQYQNRLPLYRPLTMNRWLIEHGYVSKEEYSSRSVSLGGQGEFNYPKSDLRYRDLGPEPPLNVLLITIDALRSDMIDPKFMPFTTELAAKGYNFRDHYSGGNCTRSGIFSLFYGIPSSYWQVALTAARPSAIITAAQKRGYALGIFGSAPLYRPEFNRTVFASVENLRLDSGEGGSVVRDERCIRDFTEFLGKTGSQPFFSFIFLDNVHGWTTPEDAPHPFQPAPAEVNHMELNPDTDPEPYLNVYRNAVLYADSNIRRIVDLLKERNLLERTVILITADHGDEFNDNGLNFWGHNSNFTAAEIKIPLVVYWPGREGGVIDERSVSYDVTATLLPRVFGVENPIADFSVGQDLFSLQPIDFFISGSYLENAIIERDRIVLIDDVGMLKFLDLTYRESPHRERTASILQALTQMSEYLKAN